MSGWGAATERVRVRLLAYLVISKNLERLELELDHLRIGASRLEMGDVRVDKPKHLASIGNREEILEEEGRVLIELLCDGDASGDARLNLLCKQYQETINEIVCNGIEARRASSCKQER